MTKLLKHYLVFRYKYRGIFSFIEMLRIKAGGLLTNKENKLEPLWSVFVTYNCTGKCPYCVQNYSFKNGRKDSPLCGTIDADEWLKLNEIKNKPESLIIQGGEPLLYKNLAVILEELSTFKRLQVVTNLTLDIRDLVERLKLTITHQIFFECSYHELVIDFETFLSRALLLKKNGLLGSVRMVDTDSQKTISYIKKFAEHNIKLLDLFQVGMKDGKVRVLKHAEASDLVRKPPVLCKTKLVLFAPDGYVYNCHTKLYWGDRKSSFGNVMSGFEIPDEYCICNDYGFCNPCQGGYIDIKQVDAKIKKKYRILPSNPPPGVVPSR